MKNKQVIETKQNQISTSKELIIGKSSKQALTKAQQTFNRLVKKLEKLRKELEQTSVVLSEKLDFYGKEIHPLEQNLTILRKDTLKRLFELYQSEKRLSKKDQKVLLEIIAIQLNNFLHLSREAPDEEIKKIFEAVEGISYEKASEESFEAVKEEIAETFEEFGVAVDLGEFDKNMSEADVIRKMAEMLGSLPEQTETQEIKRPMRKKTAKQIEKEEREKQLEEAKSKSLASIYKQLARIFHPDLEQDPPRRAHKEDLMKQLTIANEQGDLHTLLRLELEWIQKEEGDLDKLSEEKLSVYNQTLKEQVRDLETEVFMLSQHPRYAPLRRFSFSPFSLKFVDLKREKRHLEKMIGEIEESFNKLKSADAFQELKTIIDVFKAPKPKFNLFELNLEEIFK